MAYITFPIEESFVVDQQQIYKYAPIEGAKLILKNTTLKFTNPKNFSDPFDCNPSILEFTKTKDSVEEYKKAVNFFAATRQRRREILNSINNNRDFLSLYKHVIDDKINNSGVTCFSKTYDTTLMWPHYSDQHRGVCLQFKSTLDMS